MNKLLVQYADNKLIRNIGLSTMDFCQLLVLNTNEQLYKLFYQDKFSYCLFNSSLLNHETIQFILEFGQHINIYIYIDADIAQIPQEILQHITAVLTHHKDHHIAARQIIIPKLVNNEIFNQHSKPLRDDSIVCFLDNINTIPHHLMDYLYPNSTLHIKLFNNKDIIHPQNLGLVSEQDKSQILQTSAYYLALNDDYIPEAWACGIPVLTCEELGTKIPIKYKDAKFYQSYANFIKGLLK